MSGRLAVICLCTNAHTSYVGMSAPFQDEQGSGMAVLHGIAPVNDLKMYIELRAQEQQTILKPCRARVQNIVYVCKSAIAATIRAK